VKAEGEEIEGDGGRALEDDLAGLPVLMDDVITEVGSVSKVISFPGLDMTARGNVGLRGLLETEGLRIGLRAPFGSSLQESRRSGKKSEASATRSTHRVRIEPSSTVQGASSSAYSDSSVETAVGSLGPGRVSLGPDFDLGLVRSLGNRSGELSIIVMTSGSVSDASELEV
jgi:hypothetical protein